MSNQAPFARMNGLGNQILVVDMRGRGDRVMAEAAVALAGDPRTSFDQIMAVYDARLDGTDYHMEILNSDGSQAETCGNGTRCVVQALSAETGKQSYTFETRAGIVTAQEQADGLISVDMGRPVFDWDKIPLAEEFHDTSRIELQVGPIDAPVLHSPSVASMGNPHAIFWVEDDIHNYDIRRFGPLLEHHPIFPQRANITIAQVTSPESLEMWTWERGAGLTKACGSGACATAVSAARTGRTGRSVNVTVPGGLLHIEWRADDHVIMTGPAEWEWSGRVDPATGAWEREGEAA